MTKMKRLERQQVVANVRVLLIALTVAIRQQQLAECETSILMVRRQVAGARYDNVIHAKLPRCAYLDFIVYDRSPTVRTASS